MLRISYFLFILLRFFFFFKQKTSYEMRISDCSSDVCSSDLADAHVDDDLVEPGHRHRICVAELLDKCPADLVVIDLLQPGRVFFSHRYAPLSEWRCGPSCRPPS